MDTRLLGEEAHIVAVGVRRVGFEDVVRKKDVSDMILIDVIDHILSEIT